MISKQMLDWGANGNSIREIAAYGERRAAEIGADAILLAKNIDGLCARGHRAPAAYRATHAAARLCARAGHGVGA